MKLSKKANTMISLSWVFMIIIGGFFLILTYNIIGKYQDNEEAKYDIELRQSFRGILNNVGRTEGIEENSLKPLGNIFKNKEVEIICNDDIPILSINSNLDSENEFLRNYPTFMTKISEGTISNSYLAVESFRIPFKTTNLLAIVSKKNLIVFDSNSQISQKLALKFEKGSYRDLNYMFVNFETFDPNELEEKIKEMNIQTINFVSDESINLNSEFLDNLNSIVYHIKIDDKDGYGAINYYLNNELIKTFNYVDFDESLSLATMATFSNPQTFECSYKSVIDNSIETYNFYISKTDVLIEESKTKKICSSTLVRDNDPDIEGSQQTTLYTSFKILLEQTKDLIENERFNNPENLNNLIKQIDSKTKQLESFSCAYVY